MSKDKLIPELRFPEFLEKEGWEIKEVGEIFQVTRGYVLSMTLVKELPTEDYPYPVFSSQTKNNGLAGYYNEYLYEDAITWTTDGANAGDVNYRDGKFYCTNVCGVLLNEEGIANPCIAELINSVSKKHVSYVGNPKLMNGVMSKIQIPVPSIKEQQKIASCLSSLDELIAAHNDKLDALKDHKKGLLQNLFPQEGETVPKVRFPEFEGDGEWVEETIDSVSLLVTDYVANGSFQSLRENVNVSNQKGYAYYVRLVDLRAGLGHTDQKFVDQSSYQFLGKSSLNGGELLMANIGANVGEVWQMPIVDYPATLAPNMLMIKFESQTTTDFVFQFLQSGYGQRNLSLAISGSGHPKINKTDLKQVNVGIPPTRDEQQKIVSCLFAVDELITAQQDKIEQLQQHKKGLMQGLFPKIES